VSSLDTSEVRSDIAVAAVTAVCTVGLTLLLEFGLGLPDVSLLLRIAPLYVYTLYLVFGKYTPERVDPVFLWSGLVVVASAVVVFVSL
jgi:hypothetical protein